jgi:hypothetical protein
MNEDKPAQQIADYITKETNSIKRIWYWITVLLCSCFMTIILSSCSEISPDEVIDDRLPIEFNYKPTYKP